jgi:hypothetical protein
MGFAEPVIGRAFRATRWLYPSYTLGHAIVILESVITCPMCGVSKTETMPTDACQFFYECTGCGVKLRPKSGDCCVFCSYGSVPCPPKQAEDDAGCCTR